MSQENNFLKAFTMIELLIAIAIIGILATISVVSFNSVRSSARDSTRLSDITKIAMALEKYYNIHRSYPVCNGGDASLNSDWYTCLAPKLKPFLDPLPRDPSGKSLGYHYIAGFHPVYKTQYARLSFPLEKPNPNLSNASFSWYSGQYGFYMYNRNFGLY